MAQSRNHSDASNHNSAGTHLQLCADLNLIRIVAGLQESPDAVYHLPHATNGLRGLIGDVYVEFVLYGEEDINSVQRIDLQFLKSAVDLNSLRGDVLSGCNDIDDTLL